MIRPSLSTMRWIFLGVAAFILGAVGLSYHPGVSSSFQKFSCQVRDTLAQMSAPDNSSIASVDCQSANTKDGEIYFVSCGGFF